MSDPVMKIQIIARAEMALLQIRAERVAGRSTLFIVAMVFALLALAMLNFAAFHAIAPGQGPALAALFVALIDLGAAVITIAAARKAGPTESQERLAREIRELAYTELNRDVEQVQAEVQETVAEVRRLRSSVQGIGALVGLVGKLASGD